MQEHLLYLGGRTFEVGEVIFQLAPPPPNGGQVIDSVQGIPLIVENVTHGSDSNGNYVEFKGDGFINFKDSRLNYPGIRLDFTLSNLTFPLGSRGITILDTRSVVSDNSKRDTCYLSCKESLLWERWDYVPANGAVIYRDSLLNKRFSYSIELLDTGTNWTTSLVSGTRSRSIPFLNKDIDFLMGHIKFPTPTSDTYLNGRIYNFKITRIK